MASNEKSSPSSRPGRRRWTRAALVAVAAPVLMFLGACTSAQETATSAPSSAASDPSCRTVATALFDQLLAGASPTSLAERFDEKVDWSIPGNTAVVPWIGPREGRAGVAEFYTELGQMAKVEQFTIDTIIGDGDRCVLLGDLKTTVLSTGRDITTDFAYDIEVRNGLITRYHMFEDSWAVAEALEPTAN
ncbi:hypothetical protein JCM9533A_11620 [Catenuloplanes niger JCM 9533]